jgi:hypothetical protein
MEVQNLENPEVDSIRNSNISVGVQQIIYNSPGIIVENASIFSCGVYFIISGVNQLAEAKESSFTNLPETKTKLDSKLVRMHYSGYMGRRQKHYSRIQ